MRHLGRVALLLAIVGGTAVLTLPNSEAAQTCFGKAATIADHTGTIQGTDGDDVIIGDDGFNNIFRNGGFDRICSGGDGDWIESQADDGHIWVKGGAGGDLIYGSDEDDRLYGGDGRDTLVGTGGNDELHGDAGDDRLQGEAGNDELNGGMMTISSMAVPALTVTSRDRAKTYAPKNSADWSSPAKAHHPRCPIVSTKRSGLTLLGTW